MQTHCAGIDRVETGIFPEENKIHTQASGEVTVEKSTGKPQTPISFTIC